MPRLILIVLVAWLALTSGCSRRSVPGGASGSKPDQARKNAEAQAVNAVTGAADARARENPSLVRNSRSGLIDKVVAQVPDTIKTNVGAKVNPHLGPGAVVVETSTQNAKSLPEPKALPRPGSPPVIRDRVVSSVPYANEADAEADAINVACDLVQRRFSEFEPALKYRPSPNEMKVEFLRRDSKTVRQPSTAERDEFAKQGIVGNLVYVEYDVEVTPEQVRHLRTRDRVGDAARIFAGLTAIALAAFLFLRADEWTKGYLTRWLAAGAVLLAGGVAATLYFV